MPGAHVGLHAPETYQGHGRVVPVWTYTYTLDGNQQVRGPTDPIAANGLHTYVRNALEQVTGDTQTGGSNPTSIGWGYDSAYRLASRSNSAAGTSSTYTADNADERTGLTTTTNGATSQNLSFTYDRKGNRLTASDSVSGSNLSYTYDQEDRLTAVISGTTTLATYSYDGDGPRQGSAANRQPGKHGIARLHFDAVVKGRERRVHATPQQGAAQQFVRQGRILGQQGAMQVGAKGIALDGALGAVGAIIALPMPDPSQRL